MYLCTNPLFSLLAQKFSGMFHVKSEGCNKPPPLLRAWKLIQRWNYLSKSTEEADILNIKVEYEYSAAQESIVFSILKYENIVEECQITLLCNWNITILLKS